jgi:hypothetical protein
VSIGDLLAAMKVTEDWADSCLERAWNFGLMRSNEEHARVQRAVNSDPFKEWAWEDGPQILLLREPARCNHNEPTEIEAGEFTTLSHHVAGFALDMVEYRGAFSLTFFCGAYEALRRSAERIHIYLFRSFCLQLLSIPGLQFDPAEFGYGDTFLETVAARRSKATCATLRRAGHGVFQVRRYSGLFH